MIGVRIPVGAPYSAMDIIVRILHAILDISVGILVMSTILVIATLSYNLFIYLGISSIYAEALTIISALSLYIILSYIYLIIRRAYE